MISRKKGLTFMELLVVIGILGILSTIVILFVNAGRAKGRDAQRMSDIEEIHAAIEFYILDNGVAPSFQTDSCSDPESKDSTCFANDMGKSPFTWSQLQEDLSPYISELPTDPCGEACYQKQPLYDGHFSYVYVAPGALSYLNDKYGPGTNNATKYQIYAQNLETRQETFGFGLDAPEKK